MAGEGDEVPVLSNLLVLGNPGDDISKFKAQGARSEAESRERSESGGLKAQEESPMVREELLTTEVITGDKIKISPRARKMAGKLSLPVGNIRGTGPGGRIIERDVEAYAAGGGRLSPVASALAVDGGLTAPLAGSGPGGRILSTDLQKAAPGTGGDSTVKKISNIRRIIAEKMHSSLQNSAQLTHHMSADARAMLNLRKEIKKKTEDEGYPNVTINDMVCFAVIKALKKMPEINSHFLGDTIRTFSKVHLGIAVDTDRGLMVPALRNAGDLSIEELSNELKKLANSCKSGNIDPDLLAPAAASFTISNLGAFGVEMFTPVINLPQSGILGVNTIIQRPGDVGGGIIGFIPYIGLSLTYDHRTIDGAPASAFLREVKEQIENLTIFGNS